jgi:lysophospholipid acyltransferase (LPLAT)-like uncharacterized protein
MKSLRFKSVGAFGAGLLKGHFLTTQIERVGSEHYGRFREIGQPVMFVFWHGQLLPLVHYHRNEDIVVLVSEHDDGEYLSRVLLRNGFGVVRGSSTRGGARGIKGLVDAAKEGRDVAVTPDGPRGPSGVFKHGALAVAQAAGLPIIPIVVSSTSEWRLKSWDDFMVPKPFSRIRIQYLEARAIPRGASRADLSLLADELGDTLRAGTVG